MDCSGGTRVVEAVVASKTCIFLELVKWELMEAPYCNLNNSQAGPEVILIISIVYLLYIRYILVKCDVALLTGKSSTRATITPREVETAEQLVSQSKCGHRLDC